MSGIAKKNQNMTKDAVTGFLSSLGAGEATSISKAVQMLAAQEFVDFPDGAADGKAGPAWEAVAAIAHELSSARRLRQMLDQMPVSVMTTDPGTHEIAYANGTCVSELEALGAALPFKPGEAVGQNADLFFTGQRADCARLSDPDQLPHSTVIDLGGERFDLNMSALRNRDNKFTGAMLTLRRVTDELQMAERVKTVVESVAAATAHVEETVRSMTGLAETATGKTAAVAEASGHASSNVEAVAGAAEELSASVREIGQQVMKSSEIATRAVEQARATNTTVQSLNEAASRIGEVVKLLTDIASQTNLLALTANIEAARAGEHGRGFTVVANEVRALSQRTTELTDRINDKVGQIVLGVDASHSRSIEAMQTTRDNIASTKHYLASLAEENQHIKQLSGSISNSALLAQIELANIEEMQLRMDVYRVYLGTLAAEQCDVVDSNTCGIGRWYYSELFRQRFKSHHSYQAIEAPHDQVHQCAQAVVNAVQTNNRPLAQQKLAEMEQYNREVNEHIQTMSENLLEEV